MKERYHKLQKKMALIEDDNSRLITGKSELFGEIGKLQVCHHITEVNFLHKSSITDTIIDKYCQTSKTEFIDNEILFNITHVTGEQYQAPREKPSAEPRDSQ